MGCFSKASITRSCNTTFHGLYKGSQFFCYAKSLTWWPFPPLQPPLQIAWSELSSLFFFFLLLCSHVFEICLRYYHISYFKYPEDRPILQYFKCPHYETYGQRSGNRKVGKEVWQVEYFPKHGRWGAWPARFKNRCVPLLKFPSVSVQVIILKLRLLFICHHIQDSRAKTHPCVCNQLIQLVSKLWHFAK